ncbi:hypothetical protein HMPREF1624_01792 [Sporothrix schenckii ATCC 58251]|uniref:PH domain-containing protein n=1 Tax=Sporothrix schenckii (strain ATCC 58251 / de Perez 2211183) TaxID=1391915 RepID=U7Q8F4_SPOS1|nr:hypothetical protein HMPREF1624_01792 [Sporothrix schenckii ATCC 58251]
MSGMPNNGGRVALLLEGCYSEAMAANMVAGCVDNLRGFLAEPLHPLMIALADEMRKCGNVFLRILEQARTHPGRVPTMLGYLDILLPSFQKSVDDIRTHYEDKTKNKEIRWRTMYHKMTDEAGGIHLPQRFSLYYQFLLLMSQMLIRSPQFDMNAMEALQNRVCQLREKQGIKSPPSPAGPLVMSAAAAVFRDRSLHWAEDIFSRPLPSRTPLKHLKFSECYGPWKDAIVPKEARILFRRSFDQDRLTILAFINPFDRCPYLVVRSLDTGTNMSAFSIYGVHELCIERDGSCLVIKRWSHTENTSKLWVLLYFLTWEELVLFHCTFVAMKFEGPTGAVHPIELNISREKRLFQAYRPEHMRQNKYNALELDFFTEEAQESFRELFYSPPKATDGSNPTESTAPTDDGERTDASK